MILTIVGSPARRKRETSTRSHDTFFTGLLLGDIMKKKSSYWEKLKDPRWQKKRLEVLNYANFKCEICGDSESILHVHHKAYKKNADPWDYDFDQLQSLCEKCHKSEHDIDELINECLYNLKTCYSGEYSKTFLLGVLQAITFGYGPYDEEIIIIDADHVRGIAYYLNIDIDQLISMIDYSILDYNKISWLIDAEERKTYIRSLTKDELLKHLSYEWAKPKFWPEELKEEIRKRFGIVIQ